MITYMDRTIIASAMPLIQKEFGFSLITAGWILTSLPRGLHAFPTSRRLVRRQNRPAPRARNHRHLVEHIHLPHHLRLERRLHGRHPVHFWRGRIRRVPHRHAFAIPLDAPRRTRLRAGHHTCRFAVGRRCHSAARGLDDPALRLAYAFSHFRGPRPRRGPRSGSSTIAMLPSSITASTPPSSS